MHKVSSSISGVEPSLRILLADDEPAVLEEVGAALAELDHEVVMSCDGRQVCDYLDARSFDLVISDVRLPGVDGFSILRRVRAQAPLTEVVLMSGHASVADAIAAIREDAVDYVTKPFQMAKLLTLVEGVAERLRLRQASAWAREQMPDVDEPDLLIGHSPVMVRLRDRLAAFAGSQAPVLVLGESGTGKELAARLLHHKSVRSAKPFVAINCAAFTETLIEAELFGHVRGAFTGAVRDRKGQLAAADSGTLFLDEIAELSPSAQAKLLRVLQEGTYTPVGSSTPVSVDIRLVSATHQDLKRAIAEGRFREDLFFRIKVLDVLVPTLAQRPGDIPLLVEHFLRRFTAPGSPVPHLTPRAWAALVHHRFPGNVRELEHAIQYAIVVSGGGEIGVDHFPDDIRGELTVEGSTSPSGPLQLGTAVEFFEREYILRALADSGGRKAKAAELLGISRKHLWHKMRAHHM